MTNQESRLGMLIYKYLKDTKIGQLAASKDQVNQKLAIELILSQHQIERDIASKMVYEFHHRNYRFRVLHHPRIGHCFFFDEVVDNFTNRGKPIIFTEHSAPSYNWNEQRRAPISIPKQYIFDSLSKMLTAGWQILEYDTLHDYHLEFVRQVEDVTRNKQGYVTNTMKMMLTVIRENCFINENANSKRRSIQSIL